MRSILIGAVVTMGLTFASTVPTLSGPANYSAAINQTAAVTPLIKAQGKNCRCVQPGRNGRGCFKYSCSYAFRRLISR